MLSAEDQLKKYYPEDYITGELKKEKAISLIADSVVLVDELKKPEEAPAEEAKSEEAPAEDDKGEAEA